MIFRDSLLRLIGYTRRHGLGSLLGRAATLTRRTLFQNKLVVFSCDLQALAESSTSVPPLPEHLHITRLTRFEDIQDRDWQKIVSDRTPQVCRKTFVKRFNQSSTLWLVHNNGNPAGYGWTIVGRTVESFYFPLREGDVHFFDFMVFPEHRGHRINPNLVNFMLVELSRENKKRAFIDVAEWNAAQLLSLGRTFFQRLGFARNASFFRKAWIEWDERQAAHKGTAI